MRGRVVTLATARPRVYVVEAPGGRYVRAETHRELDRRGWQPAPSPASADALLIAGTLPDPLRAAADVLWSQLPGPRARAEPTAVSSVPSTLDGLRACLRDRAGQLADRRGRELDEATRWLRSDSARHDETHHDDMDHDDMEHDDMAHDDMEMAPGGLVLAQGAPDRDGLEMDALRHPLGPLLDRWPGGLELVTTLHGDVVVEAEVTWWEPPHPTAPPQTGRADDLAGGWDAAATVLSLLGDERQARLARSVAPSSPEVGGRVLRRLDRLTRRGALPRAAGEVLHTALADSVPALISDDELVELVSGRDLGDVRLLVAAHAPLLQGVVDASGSLDD